jgi:N-acetylneuraminic acid mutarotase
MKHPAFLLFLSSLFLLSACSKNSSDDDSDLVGNWVRSEDFRGDPRSEAVSFVIGNKAYVGTGLFATNGQYSNEFYRLDLDLGYWEKIADFPGEMRRGAVAFTAGGKAYVSCGFNGPANKLLNDFWEYDPATDKWTELDPFPGVTRRNAVAFTLNDKGYIATGYNTSALSDCWEFNPVNGSWTEKASIRGRKRSQAVAFVVNGKAYVCSGNNNGEALNDLQLFDPVANNGQGTWTDLRKLTNVSDESYDDDYANIARYGAVAFTMSNKVYLATGRAGSLISDTWEYDPATDLWNKKTSFEGTAREGAVGFTLKDKGFILTGRSGSEIFDNMFEFRPFDEQDDNDNN